MKTGYYWCRIEGGVAEWRLALVNVEEQSVSLPGCSPLSFDDAVEIGEPILLADPDAKGLGEPFHSDDLVSVYRGDSLLMLKQLEPDSVGAIVTDPPYSSGGQYRGDRANANTSTKYQNTSTIKTYHEFAGDNRDQRSFLAWCSLWLADAHRAAVSGAPIVLFSDWRQLPTITDALQAGGWVWRGVVPWDKTEMCRPTLGRFASQCEYAIWGSKGSMKQEGDCLAGIVRQQVERNKPHMTAKPVEVLRFLCGVVKSQGIAKPILDPFAGGGSTLVAAASIGLQSIGFEQVLGYCETIRDRLNLVKRQGPQSVQPSLFSGDK